MKETQVWSLGWEDALEKGLAAHSSILAWRIPWTEEPGRLRPIIESQRVRHDLATEHTHACRKFNLICSDRKIVVALFARAVLTKYHRLGGLNNTNSFSHHSEARKSEARFPARFISFWGLCLSYSEACFSRVPMRSFLCAHVAFLSPRVSEFLLIVRTPVRWIRVHLMTLT